MVVVDSSSYIGETCHYFKTRIEENIKKDNKSHIFKLLHSNTECFDSYNFLCFKTIDKANSKFDLKTKEALHINWRNLKWTKYYLVLTLPLYLLSPLVLSVFVWLFIYLFFLAFLFNLLFSLSLILIIGIFYCLKYISLLLHLIITHLVTLIYIIMIYINITSFELIS